MMPLKNKTAFITGASRGIGQAIALKFAQAGANIAFTYLESGQQDNFPIHQASLDYQVKVKGFHADVSDFALTAQVIHRVMDQFGSIDILVNNAGITKDNLLLRMSEEDWDAVQNVNLKSVFNTVHAALPLLLKQRSGSIINISSVVGIKGNPGQANYAASKAGIIGFTKSMALELGKKNIRVNAIAPGFIDTSMTSSLTDEQKKTWKNAIPLQRIGLPEDVANCALFLASEHSSYITGQVIQVDGGMVT